MVNPTFETAKYLNYYQDFMILWLETKIPFWLLRAMLCRQMVQSILEDDNQTISCLMEMFDWIESSYGLTDIRDKLSTKFGDKKCQQKSMMEELKEPLTEIL